MAHIDVVCEGGRICSVFYLWGGVGRGDDSRLKARNCDLMGIAIRRVPIIVRVILVVLKVKRKQQQYQTASCQ